MIAKLHYNSHGTHDCYATHHVSASASHQEIVENLCNAVNFCEGVPFDEFEQEMINENGVVYGFDGIGVFIANDQHQMQELYDEWLGR